MCSGSVTAACRPTHATELLSAAMAAPSVIDLRRRHAVHVDDFEPEAGDPQHEPGEGCRVWQLGAKGGGARADGDLTVVEFRAQRGACLAGEGDLICL